MYRDRKHSKIYWGTWKDRGAPTRLHIARSESHSCWSLVRRLFTSSRSCRASSTLCSSCASWRRSRLATLNFRCSTSASDDFSSKLSRTCLSSHSRSRSSEFCRASFRSMTSRFELSVTSFVSSSEVAQMSSSRDLSRIWTKKLNACIVVQKVMTWRCYNGTDVCLLLLSRLKLVDLYFKIVHSSLTFFKLLTKLSVFILQILKTKYILIPAQWKLNK